MLTKNGFFMVQIDKNCKEGVKILILEKNHKFFWQAVSWPLMVLWSSVWSNFVANLFYINKVYNSYSHKMVSSWPKLKNKKILQFFEYSIGFSKFLQVENLNYLLLSKPKEHIKKLKIPKCMQGKMLMLLKYIKCSKWYFVNIV